ncbi:MAG: hypothetical protein GYA34_15580 [Chloroflexi bacterium]|nr:hypothetical protein [Chloroflexota bacterium]
MIVSHPRMMIIIGFCLLLIGWFIPLLMVMQMLESTFALNFISYGASVSGLTIGIIGIALYVGKSKRKR